MTLLEKILADAVEAGVVRSSLSRDDAAGVILSTIMFNAAYAPTISGTKNASLWPAWLPKRAISIG